MKTADTMKTFLHNLTHTTRKRREVMHTMRTMHNFLQRMSFFVVDGEGSGQRAGTKI